jgi:hypothetical protein
LRERARGRGNNVMYFGQLFHPYPDPPPSRGREYKDLKTLKNTNPKLKILSWKSEVASWL